jgi:hypothetical protein
MKRCVGMVGGGECVEGVAGLMWLQGEQLREGPCLSGSRHAVPYLLLGTVIHRLLLRIESVRDVPVACAALFGSTTLCQSVHIIYLWPPGTSHGDREGAKTSPHITTSAAAWPCCMCVKHAAGLEAAVAQHSQQTALLSCGCT